MTNLPADYIQELAQCKSTLVQALIAKGQECNNDDTLTDLVGRVGNIHSGVTYGSCTLTVSKSTIELNNLPFTPIKVGIASQALLNETPISSVPYIALCSVEDSAKLLYDGTSILTGHNVTVTTVQNASGLYDTTITAQGSLVFKAYYDYTWVACSEGFSLNGGF